LESLVKASFVSNITAKVVEQASVTSLASFMNVPSSLPARVDIALFSSPHPRLALSFPMAGDDFSQGNATVDVLPHGQLSLAEFDAGACKSATALKALEACTDLGTFIEFVRSS
jgi:hypothetical protein